MGTTRKHARTGLLGGAALLLVVLGVLAMHGVGSHASGHGSAAPARHHDPATAQAVEPAMAQTAAHAADHLGSQQPAPPSWTELCLAMLAGAVLLAFASGRGSAALTVPRPRPGRAFPPGRRDRDPPSLVLLSVRRC